MGVMIHNQHGIGAVQVLEHHVRWEGADDAGRPLTITMPHAHADAVLRGPMDDETLAEIGAKLRTFDDELAELSWAKAKNRHEKDLASGDLWDVVNVCRRLAHREAFVSGRDVRSRKRSHGAANVLSPYEQGLWRRASRIVVDEIECATGDAAGWCAARLDPGCWPFSPLVLPSPGVGVDDAA